MTETWKTIMEFDGMYEVSNLGKVKSLSRRSRNRLYVGRTLKQGKHTAGYKVVNLSKGGIIKQFYVHRLVAEAFLGLSELQVNHKDLDKGNNNLTNLEFVTRQQNLIHALDNGVKTGRTKLTRKNRTDIKKLRLAGVRVKDIALKFKVLDAAIYEVLRGETWFWEK